MKNIGNNDTRCRKDSQLNKLASNLTSKMIDFCIVLKDRNRIETEGGTERESRKQKETEDLIERKGRKRKAERNFIRRER